MSAKRLEQVALATKTAFVFPGQGSQKVGMLAEGYARDAIRAVQDARKAADLDKAGIDIRKPSRSLKEVFTQLETRLSAALTPTITRKSFVIF